MRILVRGVRAIGRVLWRSKQLDADMQEEMRFHVQMEAERLIRIEGLHPEEARRQAYVRFGGVEKIQGRSTRSARVLLARWRFARCAPPTPLCTRWCTRSCSVRCRSASRIGSSPSASSVRERTVSHSPCPISPTLHNPTGRSRGLPRSLDGAPTSPAAATPSGSRPCVCPPTTSTSPALVCTLDRAIQPDDEQRAVALLSHGMWQRRFGERTDAVGTSIVLDGETFTVIGVLPPDFVSLVRDVDLVVPYSPAADLYGAATARRDSCG